MCFLPYMTPIQQTTMAIDAFGGYDHNLRIADGSLYDMKNLTSDNFPVLTPRKRRGRYLTPVGDETESKAPIEGIAYMDGLVCVQQTGWLYMGDNYATFTVPQGIDDCGLHFPPVETPRNIVINGANIIFFPEKVYYNTRENTNGRSLEAGFSFSNSGYDEIRQYPSHPTLTNSNLYFTVAADREFECDNIVENGLIDDPDNGCIAFDIRDNTVPIRRWSEQTKSWVNVTTLDVHFFAREGYLEGLKTFENEIQSGDTFRVKKCAYYNGQNADVFTLIPDGSMLTADTYENWQGDKVVAFSISDQALMHQVLSAWCDVKIGFESDPEYGKDWIEILKLERKVPEMDFVLECNNRLWGCRYGLNSDDEFVNEIYAAAQGDFKSWYKFVGVSTDSYVASCGAAGPFTGAVNFNGRPLFFKENHYYLVSGDYPAEYGYSDGPIKGVQEGSGKSLVVLDRVAYYKGVDGVYAFDGYSATCISAALGDKKYRDAVAGSYGDKYYISMRGEDEQWHLFVYDTKKGLWHREDDLHIVQFCSGGGELYMLDADGVVHTVNGSGESNEIPVEWMAETGNLTTGIPYKKYLAKLNVRMKVHQGASVRIFIQYDESGKWEELFYMTATKQRSFTIPIRPKRCDHIKLKLTGVGDVEVYSIIKTLEKGSDL